MNLTGILSISGKSGLYKMVGQMKNGIVVESLEDGKRFPAHSTNKVSALEDISIYGLEGDVPLGEVFGMIYKLEEGSSSIDANASGNELRDRLLKAFPDFDQERVYTSDLKKLFKWYNVLVAQGFKPEEEVVEEKPAAKKTPAAKKKAPAKQKKAEPKTAKKGKSKS